MSQRNSPFKRRQSISTKSANGDITTTTTTSSLPSSTSSTPSIQIQRQPLRIESKISFNFKKRKDPNDNETDIKLDNDKISSKKNENNTLPINQLTQLSIDNNNNNNTQKEANKNNDENNNCTDSNKKDLSSTPSSLSSLETITSIKIKNEVKTPQSCLKKSTNNNKGKTPRSTKKVKYHENVNDENKGKEIKNDTKETKENIENNLESPIVNINQSTTQTETTSTTTTTTTPTPNEELPPQQPQPTREKITPSAESKERMILLRNILIEKLKDTPQHLKKHVREINKLFLLQVLKIPIPKEDEQKSIIKKEQQQQQKQLQQQQQQISLANAQSSFLNKPTNNTEIISTTTTTTTSSQPIQMPIESIGNLKNLEVLMRIHTLKMLIEKWSEEEKKWKTLLKEYSSNGKESIILQTPSRTKIAATNSIQNSIKKQKPPKSSSTQPNNQEENDKNINKNNNNNINNINNSNNNSQMVSPISDDPKMIQITNSISKLSIQLDEVKPRLKQVEQNSIDIEKFYDETSVYYQKQSLKNLKDVDNPKKLIKNLISNNAISLPNK
ncbi:hypothetical protein ACTFIU_004691 [Dictyostelium citrinum]